MSAREAARVFGLNRKTVRKMLAFSVPPGYRRSKPVTQPKLDPFIGIIDRILEEDRERPAKQRHAASGYWIACEQSTASRAAIRL